ncbi:MAG: alpha/beta fold hydrolase [Candidatus Eremiobacteraeota bacterium]|nr:alpha/beta fold hydrolase [Candidatus Eremiobacteraeota bacterium]
MPSTYSDALARFENVVLRESAEISAHGKSQMLANGERSPKAAVLLHGMSASPMQFAQLAQQLHERGFNVLVPRLPRHGHHDRLSDQIGLLTAAELREATMEAIEIARGLGEQVTVLGFSLGGLLSSWAAQFEDVHRVVSVAPFFGIPWMPFGMGGVLAALTLKIPNRFPWWDPIKKEKQMPAHGYPRYSTHAVAHTYDLIRDLFASARQQAPAAKNIVMVTNYRETTVNNRIARRLVKHWKAHKSQRVETHEFRDLPFSHDIIEPLRSPATVAKVYPVLLDLIDR